MISYLRFPFSPSLGGAFATQVQTTIPQNMLSVRGVDNIIELAFSARLACRCDFEAEESYRLKGLAGNPDAESDVLVTIPSATIGDGIRFQRFSQRDPTLSEHLYWSSAGSTGGFSIIGFVGEFRKDDYDCNKNRLIMMLVTAQSQRKALSLKDSIIMGAITSRGHVEIFSSYWMHDPSAICIYAHKQDFRLSDPAQLLHFYVFCAKLERDIQGTLAAELETWEFPSEAELESNKWRSPDRIIKRQRSETEESGHVNKRGRGGSDIGPVEADGFEDDQYTDILRWRDEVTLSPQ